MRIHVACCSWRIDVSPAVFQQKGDEFVAKKKMKIDARTKVKRIEQEKVCVYDVANEYESQIVSTGFIVE